MTTIKPIPPNPADTEINTFTTPKQKTRFKLEGLRVVLGGALIHFTLGSFYLWGGISLYVASYLRASDPNIDIGLVKIVFPFTNIALCLGMPFGVKLADKIGARLLSFLGIAVIALLTFITSYINSFYAYLFLYGLGVGLVSGLIYVSAYGFGWKYFPDHKGSVSGAVLAGYGFGSLTFNFIALACVNPDDLKATVKDGEDYYFTEEVYENVPFMMRILALGYLVIGMIGVLLVKVPKAVPTKVFWHHFHLAKTRENALASKDKPKIKEIELQPYKHDTKELLSEEYHEKKDQVLPSDQHSIALSSEKTSLQGSNLGRQEHDEHHKHHDEDHMVHLPRTRECTSLKQGLKSPPFWLLLFIAFFGISFGHLMANNYKVYGLLRLGNDSFVTTVGSIGSAMNGLSRIIWASLLDKFGFRKVYFVLMGIQIILAATLDGVSDTEALYLIWYALIMSCEGGLIAIAPSVSGKVFGSIYGKLIYGFVFFGVAMANLAMFFLTKFGVEPLGWANIFWICFGFSVISLLISLAFNQNYQFKQPKNAEKSENIKLKPQNVNS